VPAFSLASAKLAMPNNPAAARNVVIRLVNIIVVLLRAYFFEGFLASKRAN